MTPGIFRNIQNYVQAHGKSWKSTNLIVDIILERNTFLIQSYVYSASLDV